MPKVRGSLSTPGYFLQVGHIHLIGSHFTDKCYLDTPENVQQYSLKIVVDPIYRPDIYFIAFQEIVELTPGQILATDPAKRYRSFWILLLELIYQADVGDVHYGCFQAA